MGNGERRLKISLMIKKKRERKEKDKLTVLFFFFFKRGAEKFINLLYKVFPDGRDSTSVNGGLLSLSAAPQFIFFSHLPAPEFCIVLSFAGSSRKCWLLPFLEVFMHFL